MKTKYVLVLLVVPMIALCACSPQKSLANRLKSADRLIVMDPYDGTTMTITNDQLSRIVQALETSKKISSFGLKDTPSHTLLFLKASVHIATVPTGSAIIFYLNDTPYHDESGALLALYKKFRAEHPPKFSP